MKESRETWPKRKLRLAIQDAGNQLVGFKNYTSIQSIQEMLSKYPLKKLEEFIGESAKKINSVQPNICEKYNKLVEELQNPNLTLEQAQRIGDEAYKITH